MKRRILAVIMVMVLAFAFCSQAFAAQPKDIQLQKLIKMVDQANAKIEKAVAKAQATAKNDIDKVLKTEAKEVAKVMAYAEEIGVEVECVKVAYEIDGVLQLIDPLRVVNVGD